MSLKDKFNEHADGASSAVHAVGAGILFGLLFIGVDNYGKMKG